LLNRFSMIDLAGDHTPRTSVTIADVAQAAGVSKATVSLVLNGRDGPVRISAATRAAVADWAHRLGYQPNHAARNLRRQRSNAISLLVWRLSSAYFTEIAAGVQASTERNGYDVNVVDAGPVDAEVRALRHLRTGASDGVIVATGYHTTRGPALEALRKLAQQGAPLVMLLDRSPDPRISSIRIDDEGGAFLATRHLVSLGHRHIAHISIRGGRFDTNDGSPQFDRYQGYTRALAEANLAVDPTAIVQGAGLMAGGRASTVELLARFPDARQRPTAIFVYNDLAALGVLRALYEAGVHVPRDMAVVGFHGLELGLYTTPSLTTVSHARAQLGEMGANMLLDLIEHPGASPQAAEQVLPVELVVRESCGATPQGGNA
jgi:LacI family transcriptional regulator, repressor for deo operon, udp, cdd, tsx, nupC, and nupG